jgi:hypothetical protein
MRNSFPHGELAAVQTLSRGEKGSVGQAGTGIVLGSAFHETNAFAGDCILHGSDSLFREFPAHLRPFSRGEMR